MEITVVKPVVTADLTREEREEAFQEISKELDIPFIYLRSLLDGEDELNKIKLDRNKPNIPLLLLRKVLDYPQVFIWKGGSYHITYPLNKVEKIYSGEIKGGKEGKTKMFKSPKKEKLTYSKVPKNGKIKSSEDTSSDLDSLSVEYLDHGQVEVGGLIIDESQPNKIYYVDEIGTMGLLSRLRAYAYNEDYLYSKVFQNKHFFRTNLGTRLRYKDEKHAGLINSLVFDLCNYLKYEVPYEYIRLFMARVREGKKLESENYDFLRECMMVEESTSLEIEDKKETPDPVLKLLTPYLKFLAIRLRSSTLLSDMHNMGLSVLYHKLHYITMGGNKAQIQGYQKEVEEELSDLKSRFLREVEITRSRWKEQEETAKEQHLVYLYIRKFGYERYRALPGGKLLEVLGKKEKELLLLELKKEANTEREGKKYPWMDLYARLRQEPGLIAKKAIYASLKPYLKGGMTDWLRSKEGIPIMCPHYRDELEMQFRGAQEGEIHNHLFRYAAEGAAGDAIYCKICGEAMTYNEHMEGMGQEEAESTHDIDEEMRSYIWGLSTQVVRGYVEFKNVTTDKYLNGFITGLVDYLCDIVYLIDKKLSKVRTESRSVVDLKKKFYTLIYIWALVTKIILENPGKIKFSFTKKTGIGVMDEVVKVIMESQNILLQSLPEINEGNIEESLLVAYNNLVARYSKSRVHEAQDGDPMEFNPLYQRVVEEGGKDFASAPYKKGDSFEVAVYNCLLGYVKNRTFLRNDPAYEAELRKLKEWENNLLSVRSWEDIIPLGILPFERKISYSLSAGNEILNYLYGKKYYSDIAKICSREGKEGFHRHHWTIYVYVMLKDFKKEGIQNYPPAKLLFKLTPGSKIVDCVCHDCYASRAVVNEANIQEILDHQQALHSFYNYYYNRCPVSDDGHHMKEGTCSDCGITNALIEGLDEKYYERYSKKYQKEAQKSDARQAEGVKEIEVSAERKLLEKWKPHKSWAYEITEATGALFKYKKGEYLNLWTFMGSGEDMVFTATMSGEGLYNPGMRVTRIPSYIKDLVKDYYTLKYHGAQRRLPRGLKEILQGDLRGLENIEEFPHPYGDLIVVIQELPRLYDTEKQAEFWIEYLVSSLLGVGKILEKKVSKEFSHNFLRYEISRIIECEKITARMADKNLNAFTAADAIDYNDSSEAELSSEEDNPFSLEEMDYEGEEE